MRGRNRHRQSAAGDTGLAFATVLGQTADHARRADPALGVSVLEGDAVLGHGTLQNLTPVRLAQFLNEFDEGQFANVAAVWERLERRDDAAAPARAKLIRKVRRQLKDWSIGQLDDSPEATRQAEFLRGFYNRLTAEHAVVPSIRGGVGLAIPALCRAA